MIATENTLPLAPQNPTQEPWLLLARYGDHPHAHGLQRFTRKAAQQIVAVFDSLLGRLKRAFGGLPIYIGHPDDPEFRGSVGHSDTRAYAWIAALEAREDGLYIRPKWSEAGAALLQNAHYKFLSPRWKLRSLGEGAWEPVELISVGLTNTPNIAGPAIANAARDARLSAEVRRELPRVARSLGLEDGASVPEVSAAIERLSVSTAAVTERLSLINAQLDLALERGQIALGEREEWQKRLTQSDCAANELAAMPRARALAAKPFLSEALTPYQATRASARAEFVRAVEERMSNTGEDFPTAWNAIKETRRGIFQKFSN